MSVSKKCSLIRGDSHNFACQNGYPKDYISFLIQKCLVRWREIVICFLCLPENRVHIRSLIEHILQPIKWNYQMQFLRKSLADQSISSSVCCITNNRNWAFCSQYRCVQSTFSCDWGNRKKRRWMSNTRCRQLKIVDMVTRGHRRK